MQAVTIVIGRVAVSGMGLVLHSGALFLDADDGLLAFFNFAEGTTQARLPPA
jgi:hypothetical protein